MPLRFVILRHTPGPNSPAGSQHVHFDLMWETLPGAETLRSLQLTNEPTEPALKAGIPAREIIPHRRAYLDLPGGELSCGRGWVESWDGGTLEIEADGALLLSGTRLKTKLLISVGERGGDLTVRTQ